MLRLAITLILLAACDHSVLADADPPDRHGVGAVEIDVRGTSHVRVRKQGSVRTLLFVDEAGHEMRQSQVDLSRPAHLMFPYTRVMFASYLVVPAPKRALIVGLGGGAMIHFLRKYDPALALDVVELDRAVIEVAGKLFAVKASAKVAIHQADGLVWLRDTEARYDVIWLDAFLAVAKQVTDHTGTPRHLKTARFLALVRSRLAANGAAVFNLHHHPELEADLEAIRAAFPNVYTFTTPPDGNVIVVASLEPTRRDERALRTRARALDRDPPPVWVGGKR